MVHEEKFFVWQDFDKSLKERFKKNFNYFFKLFYRDKCIQIAFDYTYAGTTKRVYMKRFLISILFEENFLRSYLDDFSGTKRRLQIKIRDTSSKKESTRIRAITENGEILDDFVK